mgnify:CR=1 FL=1
MSESSSRSVSRFVLHMVAAMAFAAAFCPPLAHAETSDKDQPMLIEADELRHDDQTGQSVFTGNVSIRKGSIDIRAERVDVTENEKGEQTGIATGTPQKRATFKQKREGLDEFVHGTAERIEYYSVNERMVLTGNAELRRLRGTVVADEAQGQRIEYSSATGVFQVAGQIKAGQPTGRVRAVIAPKDNKTTQNKSSAP